MAITDGEHVDGAIEKIKSLASDGTEKEHELNATYFHGKELSSFITAEGGAAPLAPSLPAMRLAHG
jgi:hypothetical protein